MTTMTVDAIDTTTETAIERKRRKDREYRARKRAEADLDAIAGEALANELIVIPAEPVHVPHLTDEDDTAEETSSVDAFSGYRTIWGYDDDGKPMELGVVRYTDYEGSRNLRNLQFESYLDGKAHNMGNASGRYTVISHSRIVQPFLDAGFEIRKAIYARGGQSMDLQLGYPGTRFEDLIGWDHEWLKEHAPESYAAPERAMELAVRVRSDLRPGSGITATAGYFRLICLNGLMAKVLMMGHMVAQSRSWAVEKIEDFVSDIHILPETFPRADTALIDDVIDAYDRVMSEAERMPRLVREPAQRVADATGGERREAFRDNLLALRDGTESFSTLDLMSAYTNTAHVGRGDQASRNLTVYRHIDPVTTALTDLVELAGVKRGVPTFEPN